jgi:hypothetical protein
MSLSSIVWMARRVLEVAQPAVANQVSTLAQAVSGERVELPAQCGLMLTLRT